MIDLNWTELSFGLALFFTIAYFLYVVSFYRKCVLHPDWQQTKGNWGLFLFSLFLIIVASNGNTSDWFSYQQIVWNYDFGPQGVNHGEPVYAYIVKFVNKNYLLFRIIVWGGAFLLACITFKRFEVNVNVAAFVLVAAFLLKFNYARASLAMASYFLGLSFLLKPIKNLKVLSIALTALFFWGAYEFHHSLLPVLYITIMAYVPLNRFSLLVIIVLLPFVVSYLSNSIDVASILEDESIASKFESYTERADGFTNFLGYISKIIGYGSFVIPITIITLSINKQQKKIELPMLRFYRVTIAVFLFAVSFLFMGLQSEFFIYRYLFVTFIPISVLSTYLYENEILSRSKFTIMVLSGICAQAFSFIVGFYHTI